MEPTKEAGAHALLVSDAGKIILVAKGEAYTYFKENAGKISMFGGGMESGEEPLTALKRELSEELGLNISAKEVEELNVYRKSREQDGRDAEIHVFIIRGIDADSLAIQKEDASIRVRDENEAIVRGSVTELLARNDLTRVTRQALEDFARRG